MRFIHLTFLFCVLNFFSPDGALEYAPSSSTKVVKSITANRTKTNDAEVGATNILYQSKDGGQTWQDISDGLPVNEQPDGFFAGESDVYLSVKNVMYRSKSGLKTPVWEKETVPHPQSASIAFSRSGVMAFNYEGQVYQKTPSAGTWLPVYTNSIRHSMRTIFETYDGTLFVGSDNGLYKSSDAGESWTQVLDEGWVMDIVESEGVLMGTSQHGIIRSTDNGEHWERVISEGGVGIAIERIDGGFAAISYNASTYSRRIRMSLDKGKTWEDIDEGLQSLSISSIKQMGPYLICGHPDGIFRSADMGKTWNRVHSGVDYAYVKLLNIVHPPADSVYVKTPNMAPANDNRRVFKIYASGNVLYAVARSFGC
jgi:photosystem II stability/assembly factor-like uncharacterized protein